MQLPEDLSKERLINDLIKLRKRIDELEKIREEEEKYETELAQTRAMYEGLFKFAPDAILVIDNKGIVIQANQQADRLFGYAHEELIGLNHDMVVPDRFRERHLEDRNLYMSSPHIRPMGTGLELCARRKDGTEFPVDISLGPLQQVNNEIVALAIVRDITERKLAEQDLRESKERFQALVTASSEVLYRMSPDWSEMRQLNSWGFLVNTEKPSLTWLKDYIHPDDQPQVTAVINEAIRTKRIFELEHRVLRADGSLGWTHSRAVPLMDKNGEIAEWFGAASDITERKEAEMALQEQAQQLAEVNKDLESFNYSISHDLRTPLRGIIIFTQMILKKNGECFDSETRRLFQIIMSNAETMGRLIDNLLAFSRLGSRDVAKRSLDMEVLIEEVWQELLTINPGREINLKIGQIAVAWGDEALIRQVYINLLDNAVKFSQGKESVLIEAGSSIQDGETVYYVRDNGIGFDMQHHNKIFGVFQRLHSDEEYKGTGIGLSLVQRIITRHGGRVWAEGEVGKGATFYFTLPTQQE